MQNTWWRQGLCAIHAAGLFACGGPTYSLVDRLQEAEKDFTGGRYASFLDAPADRGSIVLDEDTRLSLTPPFPGVLRFELTLPDAAYLTLSPALVMEQSVRRARTEFAITVEFDGERTTLLAETFGHLDANQWHDREIDLTKWAGRRVTLELATRAPGGRTDMVWADRVQTVWGEPTILKRRDAELAAALEDIARTANESLSTGAETSGVRREELSRLYRFTLGLFLGGLMSLGVRELYKRYGSAVTNRAEFGSLFPIFTLSTIVVITIVRTSLALSLGLMGALSIVRFRAAIKTPEQIVYLLFCVLIGLALGAEQEILAVASALLVAAFVVGCRLFRPPAYERNFLVRVSGDATHFYGANGASALEQLRSAVRGFELQRLDRHGEQVEMRAFVTVHHEGAASFPQRLRALFPHLQFSCIEADELI
jgi:hypothetical protein